MRQVYLARFVGEMKEKEQTFTFAVLSLKQQKYNQLAKLASQTVYLYPRLHSAFDLLLSDLYSGSLSDKDRHAVLRQFVQHVVLDHFCSEETYQALKSNSRPKFLNVGLKIVTGLLKILLAKENCAISLKVVEQLICQSFMKIFVKNFQNTKSQLNDAASQFKTVLLALIQKLSLDSAQSLSFVNSFFGPNTESKLSFKRSQDLLKILASNIKAGELSDFLRTLESEFESPNLKLHF